MFTKIGIVAEPIIKRGDYQDIKVMTEKDLKEFTKKSQAELTEEESSKKMKKSGNNQQS